MNQLVGPETLDLPCEMNEDGDLVVFGVAQDIYAEEGGYQGSIRVTSFTQPSAVILTAD